MDAPFGPWRPDVGGPNSGMAQTVEGVVPQAAGNGLGYGPFPQLVSSDGAAALPDTPRGSISVQLPDGSWKFFAATSSTIEEMQAGFTWSEVEGGRSLPDEDDVSFAMLGTKLLNTDTADGFKAYDVVAGGANDAVTGAPAARATFVMKNVAFALGTSTTPRRFASSDIGNPFKWTGGASEGGTLEDGGGLVAGADLKNGLGVLFQERAIRGVQFNAGASTYAVSKIADGLGCIAERTVIAFDGRAAWWADDGPWMLGAGGAPTPIGAEKINRWAAESIGRQNFKHLQGTADPERKLFLWRIDGSRVLAFHWLLGDFSILPVNSTALARIATPAISIDSLSGTIDELPGSIDGLGGGSAPVLGGLNLSRKYATFSGAPMAATLETGRMALPASALVSWARPDDDATPGTLLVGVADRQDVPLKWKSGVSKQASGRVPLRARGMNLAFRRNIPAGASWTYANGVRDVVAQGGGPK